MAAVVLGVDSPNTAADPVASDAFTPAAGDLLIVIATASATVAAAPTCASSVGGQTFTFVRAQTHGGLHSAAAFVCNQFATAVSQTVTVTWTGDVSTGGVQIVLRVSGMTRSGASAILQSAGATGAAAGTPAASFAVAALTTNPVLGGLKNNSNPAGVIEPVGFTEHSDSGYTTPTAGGESVSRDSGHTSATVTWTALSTTEWAVIILELDASSAAGAVPYRNPMPQLIAQ